MIRYLKKLLKTHHCPRCHRRLGVLHKLHQHVKIDGVAYRYVCSKCARPKLKLIEGK